jgi:hypothetical protein
MRRGGRKLMAEGSLREQLEAVRAKLFPSESVPPERLRETARELGKLVPHALDQRLRAYIQANRKLPITEQRRRLRIIVHELSAIRADFFLAGASSRLRADLLALAAEQYEDAVRSAEEFLQTQKPERRTASPSQSWRDDAESCIHAMSSLVLDVDRPLQSLEDQDLELCLAWRGEPRDKQVSTRAAWRSYRTRDSNEALKMWSARSAEAAVISVFKQLGKTALDVSLGQIQHDGSSSWKTHDIEVNGQPFDVKNARRSFSNRYSYVEHTIPRFKQISRTKSDVTILGLVSDYVPWTRIDEGRFGSALILGQLQHADLRALSSWMGAQFGGILDFASVSGSQLPTYPGWMFEYPDDWYSKKPAAIERLKKILAKCGDCKGQQDLPVWIKVFSEPCEETTQSASATLDQDILRGFVSLRRDIGLTRRSLFAWVLGLMLQAWIGGGGQQISRVAGALKRLLFRRANAMNHALVRSFPAGLYDPMAYVSNVISLFERIGHEVPRSHIAKFQFFKMTAPTILRGQHSNGTWQTVFAHCGGWRRQPFVVPCGNNPIHLGNSEVCPDCGYLVCAECGHCMTSCTACAVRETQADSVSGFS